MKDIQARDVLSWQNELLRHRDKNGKPYSETYLKNLHNQLPVSLTMRFATMILA